MRDSTKTRLNEKKGKKKKKENVKRTEREKGGEKRDRERERERERTKERRGNVDDEAVLNRTQRRCHDEKRAVLFIMDAAAAAASTKLPRLRELLDQTRFFNFRVFTDS